MELWFEEVDDGGVDVEAFDEAFDLVAADELDLVLCFLLFEGFGVVLGFFGWAALLCGVVGVLITPQNPDLVPFPNELSEVSMVVAGCAMALIP